MNNTPTTRHRHVLRWVLGVGLVFVVVSALALQTARRRADERWERVMTHCDEEWSLIGSMDSVYPMSGGNLFRAWREDQWWTSGHHFILNLRQVRSFFGSRIEARITFSGRGHGRAMWADAARAILAAVDVKLVVEP